MKLRQHRVERRAHADQHGRLMKRRVLEALLERFERSEIAGIALHEQIEQRVLGIHRELERIVFHRLDDGDGQAEGVLHLGARFQYIHQTLHGDAQHRSELLLDRGVDARRIQTKGREQVRSAAWRSCRLRTRCRRR